MAEGGWIGVDLDGTLAHYDGWREADHIGPPVPAMLERVLRWLAEGVEVRIFTARACVADQIPAVEAWCEEHLGQRLTVTCQKDFAMIELWDDRCIRVVTNEGRPL